MTPLLSSLPKRELPVLLLINVGVANLERVWTCKSIYPVNVLRDSKHKSNSAKRFSQ